MNTNEYGLRTWIGNEAQTNVPSLGCLCTDVAHVFDFEAALVQEGDVVEHGVEFGQQHALFNALQVPGLLFGRQVLGLELFDVVSNYIQTKDYT